MYRCGHDSPYSVYRPMVGFLQMAGNVSVPQKKRKIRDILSILSSQKWFRFR